MDVLKLATEIRQSQTAREMPKAVAGLMDANEYLAKWVDSALGEIGALRDLLSKVAAAETIKAARAIAADADKIPATENPKETAKRIEAEEAIIREGNAKKAVEDRKRAETEVRVRKAKEELARIDADRKHEAELRRTLAEADMDGGEVGA